MRGRCDGAWEPGAKVILRLRLASMRLLRCVSKLTLLLFACNLGAAPHVALQVLWRLFLLKARRHAR